MTAKYWLSPAPEACDLCGKPIGEVFIDGKTRQGPWGILDETCHRLDGYGLGLGRGQKYRREADSGRYRKVEG
jgi:hypothetical protein